MGLDTCTDTINEFRLRHVSFSQILLLYAELSTIENKVLFDGSTTYGCNLKANLSCCRTWAKFCQ